MAYLIWCTVWATGTNLLMAERRLVICRFPVVVFVYHGLVRYLENWSCENWWNNPNKSNLSGSLKCKVEIIIPFYLRNFPFLFFSLFRYHKVAYNFCICIKIQHCIQCVKLKTLYQLNVCSFCYWEIANSAQIHVASIRVKALIQECCMGRIHVSVGRGVWCMYY